MDDQPTCGKGLAEHSPLPAKMGELMGAVAKVLELHMNALDLTDDNARLEYDAYQELATAHWQGASQLQATAIRMAGYRDLPMGRHEWETLSAPEHAKAFDAFVRLEVELVTLLQSRLERDRSMLAEMRGA